MLEGAGGLDEGLLVLGIGGGLVNVGTRGAFWPKER